MSIRGDGELVLRFSHPFTMTELEELDVNLISQEMMRLQKSISMLEATNATLMEAIGSLDDPQETQEYTDIVSENTEAIEKQLERTTMCKYVLAKKIGADPTNKHYELDVNTSAITAVERPTDTHAQNVTSPPPANGTATAGQYMGYSQGEAQSNDDHGLYL